MPQPETEKKEAFPATPLPSSTPVWWKTKLAHTTGFILLILFVLGLVVWFFEFRPYVSTDDARIAEDLIQIAPDGVGGMVLKINVDTGAPVTQGEILAELDHTTYEAQLQKAQANAMLTQANLKRAADLYRQAALSTRNYQMALANAQVAQADLQLAQANLEHTYLKSPINGLVVKRIAIAGNLLESGQVAFIVADVDHAWVEANIQETYIGKVKIGQPVQIHVDEGGDLTGHVSEITAAAESEFALLPAENASGNYIKLVQSIPIKIALDPHPGRVLKDGESVEIKIKVD